MPVNNSILLLHAFMELQRGLKLPTQSTTYMSVDSHQFWAIYSLSKGVEALLQCDFPYGFSFSHWVFELFLDVKKSLILYLSVSLFDVCVIIGFQIVPDCKSVRSVQPCEANSAVILGYKRSMTI